PSHHLPPPPPPTLFPYTTLFRSPALDVGPVPYERSPQLRHGLGEIGVALSPLVDRLDVCDSKPIGDLVRAHELLRVVLGHHVAQDRKSTRLNSSHVAISYAVFCL